MTKTSSKTIIRDTQKAFFVKKVAEMHNVSTSFVYKILSGDRENDEIFMTYMDLQEGTNSLLEQVKRMIII